MLEVRRFGAGCTDLSSGDKPLIEALELMANESISSLPVLDNHSNVIGNISQVDVKVSLSPSLLSNPFIPFNTSRTSYHTL